MPKFEQRNVDGPNNVGLFALEGISKGTIIFRDAPFYSLPPEILNDYMLDKNPTGNPDLDAEIRTLQLHIPTAMASFHCRGQSSSFNEEYPPHARVLLDRFFTIVVEEAFKTQSKDWLVCRLGLHFRTLTK